MDPVTLAAWEAVIAGAIKLGVSSWHVIKAMASDAGLDDAQIAILSNSWNLLYDDVARAAGE